MFALVQWYDGSWKGRLLSLKTGHNSTRLSTQRCGCATQLDWKSAGSLCTQWGSGFGERSRFRISHLVCNTGPRCSLNLTWAGYWYAFVSIPIFQFILLRWYMRIIVWFRFLWQVSRLNLHLTAAHPDRAGGIGFVGDSSYAFAPFLFAQGALLAGLIASRVLFEGRNLLSFKMQAAGFIGFFVIFILAPLVIFTPRMERTKRKCKAEYGLLANRYVFEFEKKWIRGAPPASGELLGTGDIQSLADLGTAT